MSRVLIVDDEREVGDLMILLMEGMGHEVELATSGSLGLNLLGRFDHDVVFSDVHMRPMNGFDFIRQVKEKRPNAVFVFMSGDLDPEIEERGLQLGALEFLHKPLRVEELRRVLKRALNRAERERVAAAPAQVAAVVAKPAVTQEAIESELESFLPGVPLASVRRQVAQLARSNRHALIEAHPGMLSSELLQYMHEVSPFARGPLVVRNLTSEPATSIKQLLAQAKGGTLVLLEIESLPAELQQDLVAPLRELDRLRVISVTQHDPDTLNVEGKLTGALYSRLALFGLRLAPLAEEPETIPDILIAAMHQAPFYPFGTAEIEVEPAAAQALRAHPWADNLLELAGVAERLVARLKEPKITLGSLPERIQGARLPSLEECLREAEARHVRRALRVLGTVAEAATALGVPEPELESYGKGDATAPFFSLRRETAEPIAIPPPVRERVLIVAGDELVRQTACAILAGKNLEIAAVPDGLAAVAAMVLAPQPFVAALVISPLGVFEPNELGAQLLRLNPHLRIGLIGGRAPDADPAPFHLVAPSFRRAEDIVNALNQLQHEVAVRPAA